MSALILERPSNVRSFYRKTKRGSIIKIVREHYLRDDISCGIKCCQVCRISPNEVTLAERPRQGISKLVPGAHIIIPDISVVFNQIDVLEDEAFGPDVLILQTVRNLIRSRNLSVFSRVNNLPRQRRFLVFMNEYHKDSYCIPTPDESTNAYPFRLIVKAVKWYHEHLKDHDVTPVLLVDDEESKEKASHEVVCYTTLEYVQSLKNCLNLLDKVVNVETKMEIDEPKSFIYPEHLSLSEIQKGVREGKYFHAKFETNRDNYLEGTVTINMNGEATRVLIIGREAINRAIHEDIVAIELAPESEWRSKSGIVLTADQDIEEKNEEDIENPTENLEENESQSEFKRPTGRVVGIVKRKWRQYCGILRERNEDIMSSMVITSHFFIPAEKRIPFIRIETRQYETLKNQRIVVAIDRWPRDSKYPKGHYVRAIGAIGEKATENELLLLEHDVPHLQFSKSVLKCLPDPNTWSISEDEVSQRFDLREKPICSVDPPGCTDIDDALHCIELENGVLEVGVHIADVSHFVKPNSALDLEAANRGTTVYLVDNRIDMIPTVLSSNLCSLIEKKDRLTFSVIWKIEAKTGEVLETNFCKSIISSRAAMTYAEAQLKIDSTELQDEVTQGLRRLNSLAKKLKKKRMDNGALVLANLGEIKFIEMDSETHDNVTKIESKQLMETNSMVEEFMLLANISVAKKLFEELPQLALLRCHPKPSVNNFDELILAAKSKGFQVNVNDGKSLSTSLDTIKDSKNPYLNLMFRIITTRCMTQAYYFCSGKISDTQNDFAHFGLATPIYTHFTSPIRRYADLIVHRLLSHVIGTTNLAAVLTSSERIQALCDNINYRHRQAQYASRASIKLHTIIHIKSSKSPLKEEGYVLFVRRNAVQILIPRIAFETTYFLKPLSDWHYDDVNLHVKHLKTGIVLKQFDPIKVKLGLLDQTNQFRKGSEIIQVAFIDPPIPLEN